MPYLTLRDLRMYYEEMGPADAPAVVLMHGGGGSCDDVGGGWAGLTSHFIDRFHVFLPDHRGHGRTNNPAGFMTFEQMTDDMAAFVAEVGVGPVHLAGLSDGGVVALDCALRYPEMTRSAVCVGGNYCVDEQTLAVLPMLDADTIEREHPEAAAALAARHDHGEYPGFWRDLLRHIRDNNAVNPSWTVDDLRRIIRPVLVVGGENDPFANTDQMYVMKREIPGAEWLIVNHAGHPVHYEYPDIVGPRVADFFARNS